MNELSNKLSKYFNKYYKNFEKKYQDSSLNYLTEGRIDIVAKIIYCEFFLNITPTSFNKMFYYLHLKKWNNAKARDSNKNNFSDFEKSFKEIILSIKKIGFDDQKSIIPVDEDNNIIDGSHRVAASIVLNKKITVAKFKVKSPKIDITSFAQRFNFMKNETLMNYLILNYIKYNKNLRIFILFPIRDKNYDSDCIKTLNKYGKIEVKKTINVGSLINAFNMCRTFYEGSDWIGNEKNNYKGAAWKSKSCFGNTDGKIEVLLFNPFKKDYGTVSNLKKIKETIRSYYKIRFHSIHSSDTHNETIRYSKIFFHTKTHQLSLKRKDKFFSKLENFLEELNKDKIDSSHFVFSGSSVMAALGLRGPKDFDAFHSPSFILPKGITSHNNFKYLNEKINEIVYNPKKYFYYMGFKFLDPLILLNLKINRYKSKGQIKDKNDIEILKNFLFEYNNQNLN